MNKDPFIDGDFGNRRHRLLMAPVNFSRVKNLRNKPEGKKQFPGVNRQL